MKLGRFEKFLADPRLVKAAKLAKCTPRAFLVRLLRNSGIRG